MDLATGFILSSLIGFIFGETCVGPTTNTAAYSTKSAILSSKTSYVLEFSVACSQGSAAELNLYAELNQEIIPVGKASDKDLYQISWAADNKKALTGDVAIKVFNEEGYTSYRKAQRAGEDIATIPSVFTVSLNHPGSVREGLFVQTEFLAVIASLLIWWMANSLRSTIME